MNNFQWNVNQNIKFALEKVLFKMSTVCSDLNVFNLFSTSKGYKLTHWGRVMHICVSKLTIIGSEKGLLPGRRQAIFWTNAGILLIAPLGLNFREILIEIPTFSFKKMHLKMSSAKTAAICLVLDVLTCKKLMIKSWEHVLCPQLDNNQMFFQFYQIT